MQPDEGQQKILDLIQTVYDKVNDNVAPPLSGRPFTTSDYVSWLHIDRTLGVLASLGVFDLSALQP